MNNLLGLQVLQALAPAAGAVAAGGAGDAGAEQRAGALRQPCHDGIAGAEEGRHGDAQEDRQVEQAARRAAKAARQWAEADRLRDQLKALGIVLEDRKDGTTAWHRG